MKKVTLFVLSTLVALSLMSCGSKPEAEPETTPEAPVVEETVVEEPVIEDPVVEEPEEEAPAVDVDSLKAQIDDARNLAIAAGAEDLAPELLKAIDDYYASIKDSDADVSLSSADIILRYKTLASYAKAKDLKTQIDEHDLAVYDQKDYDEGVKSYAVIEDAYTNGTAITAETAAYADAALSSFTAVYVAGYKKLAKDERVAAFEAKKNADSVKAGVSRKEEYKAATDSFQKGDTLYAMQNPVKAYENYKSSKEAYIYLFEDVSEKRAAAQAAIEAAKKRVEESAQFAEEADYKAPITEPIEGIEDEDAVLLEADDYEDPEAAEIEVSEELTVVDQLEIVSDELNLPAVFEEK